MTSAEYRLLVLALAWILASIPIALLIWQVWLRPVRVHPVIPHEDAAPAGHFLDVPLPSAQAPPEESGVPVRQWKRVDGWIALAVVLILSLMMGPLASGESGGTDGELSSRMVTDMRTVMATQLVFQFAFAGLLLFYLTQGRGLNPVFLFGLRRTRWPFLPLRALAWLVPGAIGIGLVSLATMPWLLRLLGQESASSQMVVEALRETTDPMTKVMVALTVGIGAPFMEELVFRGFLYSVARRFTHWSYAALGSSLLFAVIHNNAMSFIPLTLLGLLFTAAYEQSRNLLVPMVMHGMFNLFQISILFYAPHLVQRLDNV